MFFWKSWKSTETDVGNVCLFALESLVVHSVKNVVSWFQVVVCAQNIVFFRKKCPTQWVNVSRCIPMKQSKKAVFTTPLLVIWVVNKHAKSIKICHSYYRSETTGGLANWRSLLHLLTSCIFSTEFHKFRMNSPYLQLWLLVKNDELWVPVPGHQSPVADSFPSSVGSRICILPSKELSPVCRWSELSTIFFSGLSMLAVNHGEISSQTGIDHHSPTFGFLTMAYTYADISQKPGTS